MSTLSAKINIQIPYRQVLNFAIKCKNIAIIFKYMILLEGEVIILKNERKAITIRVSPELKFQIDKAANKDNQTVNSWMINIIEQYLENENQKK